MIRTDFIFTYWVFAWYLLYMLGVTKFNPKFGLIGGIIENIILIIFMFYKSQFADIVLFVCIQSVLKVFPLYTIWNTKITYKDVLFTFGLFIIYEFWLRIHGTNIYKINSEIVDSVVNKKDDTPLMKLIKSIYK